MAKLWYAILLMCARYGRIDGLNDLSEEIGADYSLIYRQLGLLEERDQRLRVQHHGRGRRISISYSFKDIPPRIQLPFNRKYVITFDTDLLYRGVHAGRLN